MVMYHLDGLRNLVWNESFVMKVRISDGFYYSDDTGCVNILTGELYDVSDVGVTVLSSIADASPDDVAISDLISNLSHEYDVNTIEVERDVLEFLQQCEEEGLLIVTT